MKVALISDIHGNEVALDAVLEDLDRESPDRTVCLGDVTQGPRPKEVLDSVRALGCPVVVGNGDLWNLDPDHVRSVERLNEPGAEELRARHLELNRWIFEQLSEEDLKFLGTFEPTVELDLGGGTTLLCYHGSPRHHMDFLMADTPEAEVEEMLAGRCATVMAGGHTHVQMVRGFKGIIVINAGSVGLPLARASDSFPVLNGPPVSRPARAEYALVSRIGRSMRIELRRIRIDGEAVMRMVRSSEMPHADWYYGAWVKV
jgi:predicted phosphodiesterase